MLTNGAWGLFSCKLAVNLHEIASLAFLLACMQATSLHALGLHASLRASAWNSRKHYKLAASAYNLLDTCMQLVWTCAVTWHLQPEFTCMQPAFTCVKVHVIACYCLHELACKLACNCDGNLNNVEDPPQPNPWPMFKKNTREMDYPVDLLLIIGVTKCVI